MLIAPFSHFFCGSRQLFLHKLGRALCSHALRFAAFSLAFSTQLALRLARVSSAFCCKTQCILHHFAKC